MKTGRTRIQHILQLMKLYLNKRSSAVCFSTIQRTFYLFKCTLYGPRHKVEPENIHKIQKVHTRNLKTVSVCTRVIRNGLRPVLVVNKIRKRKSKFFCIFVFVFRIVLIVVNDVTEISCSVSFLNFSTVVEGILQDSNLQSHLHFKFFDIILD